MGRNTKSESKTLRQKAEELLKKKSEAKILELIEELAFQNEEKTKRAAELIVAKEEIAFQAELIIANNKALKLYDELVASQIELKTQSDELKQNEQRYQALVEWSPYAALVHRDMKIIYVNPAAVKLFGATSELDLVGTPVNDRIHRDYHQIVQERIRRGAEEGLAAPMIVSKYFKLDGTVMDLEVQGMPINYNGLPSILATFTDVTERRRFERQLGERLKEIQTLYYLSQLSEREDLPLTALYQELTDFLPKGWQYSEIACSRIVIDGVEFRSENFEDSDWKLSAPIKSEEKVIGLIEVAYLKEMPQEDEGPFLREERLLIDNVAYQLQHIINRKLVERLLQDYNLRLASALEAGNMAWWEMDITTGNVVFHNRKAEMLGYRPEKFKHYKDFTDLLHPDDYEKAMNAMRKHFDGAAERYEVEYRILTQSGEYKWFYDIGLIVERDLNEMPLKMKLLAKQTMTYSIKRLPIFSGIMTMKC